MSARLPAIAVLVLAAAACSTGSTSVDEHFFRGQPVRDAPAAPEIALSDAHGRPFRLSDERGKVVLLFFGFVHCPDVCPATLSTWTRVRAQLGRQANDVRFVWVSVDPERDTPERMAQHLAAFDADIVGLTGPEPALADVWSAYDITREKVQLFESAAGYIVEHTPQTFLIDPAGRLRLTYAFGAPAADIVADVRFLLAHKGDLAAVERAARAEGTTPRDAPPAGPPLEQPAGHRRMVEVLATIAERTALDNPYLGLALIPRARDDLATMPPERIPERWFLNLFLGRHELRLGNEDKALEYYLEANRLLGESREAVPADKVAQTLFETGVAYLRRAESRNCVARPTAESCLFPLRDGGLYTRREDAERAIDFLGRAIDATRSPDATYLRARWLINIAYMGVGAWPAGVPQRYLIDPARFASDEPFPRFPNVARALGVDSFDLAGGAIAEDFDGDGRLDLLTSTSDTQGQMRFWVNTGRTGRTGDARFVERTAAAGLTGLFGGLNMTAADYDNDGDVDVYVLRGGWFREHGRHPNSLLRNNGDGTFTDVTFEAGLGEVHYATQTGAWADYDNDGDLDLYVGNESGIGAAFTDLEDNPTYMPSQLFRNDGDGTFTDVAQAAGVENVRYAKAVVWGDYDADRFPDLYVSNAGELNRLYRNNGDGTFTDVAPDLGVTRPVASFPAWFWDANNDGVLDLFVAAYGGVNLPADVVAVAAGCLGVTIRNESPKLYLGDGNGGFVERGTEWGLTDPTLPMGANFGDLDNDGWKDFYLGTGYPYYEGLVPNAMYRNRAGTGFADVTTNGGFGHLQKGHAVVFADLDDDGDQDVYAQMGGAYPGDGFYNALYENPGFGNHWVKLRLVGVRSNRFGVGARIRIDIVEQGAPRSIWTWVNTGGSFGVNPHRREIGLGKATRIERLEVYWPTSDTTQTFEALPADRTYTVTEGDPEVQVRRP